MLEKENKYGYDRAMLTEVQIEDVEAEEITESLEEYLARYKSYFENTLQAKYAY